MTKYNYETAASFKIKFVLFHIKIVKIDVPIWILKKKREI